MKDPTPTKKLALEPLFGSKRYFFLKKNSILGQHFKDLRPIAGNVYIQICQSTHIGIVQCCVYKIHKKSTMEITLTDLKTVKYDLHLKIWT